MLLLENYIEDEMEMLMAINEIKGRFC